MNSQALDNWDSISRIITEIDSLQGLEIDSKPSPSRYYKSYIDIYKKLPIDERKSRESERLRFKFTREFYDDKSNEDPGIIRRIKLEAKIIIDAFDFNNAPHGLNDSVRIHTHNICSDGHIAFFRIDS